LLAKRIDAGADIDPVNALASQAGGDFVL